MAIHDVIGFTGAGFYILSYAMLQWRRNFARHFMYSFMNFSAAGLVALSLTYTWNSAALFIQGTWIVISLYGMYRCVKTRLRQKRKKRQQLASHGQKA